MNHELCHECYWCACKRIVGCREIRATGTQLRHQLLARFYHRTSIGPSRGAGILHVRSPATCCVEYWFTLVECVSFPVVDNARAAVFDLLVGFNDTFFMSLMFFLIASSNFSRGLSSHGTQVQRVLLEFIRPVLCADQPAAPLLRLFRSRDRHRSLRHQSKLAGGGWKVGPWLVAMDDCRNHCLHGEHGNRSDGYEVSKF